ncbi:hypothetical protein CL614_08410 [archaeon]|nr:hypothetical protein [archaeon]|tara:strand:- start:2915 stop:3643 length:729 start_codon:yes stop_codon:yes gene_type:complete
MSSEKIVHEINKTDLSKAKDSLEQLLYEKMAMSLSERKLKKLDPVGDEDSDIDNDGDSDESDEYLKNRRKVRRKEIDDDEIQNEGYIKEKPNGTWCVYNDDDKVIKEFNSKSAAEDFLKEEIERLDEFLPLIPLAMTAARAIGGRLLKKVGGRALKAVGGMAKKALGGAVRGAAGALGGRDGTSFVPRRANEDTEQDYDSDKEVLYGMDKDRYMRLSDEEKDKVRANYHRMKKEEGKEQDKK